MAFFGPRLLYFKILSDENLNMYWAVQIPIGNTSLPLETNRILKDTISYYIVNKLWKINIQKF